MPTRIRSLKQLGKHVRIRDDPGQRRKKTPWPPREISPPQYALWEMVRHIYPDAEAEKGGLVPGRRYTVDIVIERLKLVLELDGWAHHGKYKEGFQRDREKDRALLLAVVCPA